MFLFFPSSNLAKEKKLLAPQCVNQPVPWEREGKGEKKGEREANDVDLKRGARLLDGVGREDATPRAATLTHRVYLARGPPRPIVV